MAAAKVTINGTTILNLTDATAEASNIISPYSAYGADGSKLIGSVSGAELVTISVPSPEDQVDTEWYLDDSDGEISYSIAGGGLHSFVYQPGYIDTNNTVFVSIFINSIYQLPTQSAVAITPTESQQTAVPKGKFTTGAVTVNAIPSNYVGSGITQRSSTDLSASGATVTVPAGYYSSQVTKSVTTMTLPTSAASSATSGYTSKATISRSTSAQYINIPPGYNSAGGYYTISAVANGSATAPASISGTSATVSTGTNTLTLTKTVSVTPSVTAGYISSGTAGNASVTLTASVTTKAAATITPTKSSQTIASGTYLTGTQTIAAIPAAYQDVTGVTAAAGDVVSGKSIVSSTGATVNGTLVIQHYYTGSSAPSSSLGVNGDIYLQTS